MKLTRSYRSSYEIMQFAQAVSPNPELIAMERGGKPPEVLKCRNRMEQTARLRELVHAFVDSRYNTLGR